MEEEESSPSVAGDEVKEERPAVNPAALPEPSRRGLAAALLNVARGRWKRVKDLVSATKRYVHQGQPTKGRGVGRHARAGAGRVGPWPKSMGTHGPLVQMMFLYHRTDHTHEVALLPTRA